MRLDLGGRAFHADRERGSITIFFVLFALIMIGVVAYSLFVGRSVDEKIKVDVAADAATLSMASHSAQGLNMIAVNNLAVAANLHVMASTTFIGRYYAIARALLSGIEDLPQIFIMSLPFDMDGNDYADGFAWTAPFNGHFSKTAAGLTAINKKIGSLWLYATPIKGVEQTRMNAPGAVVVPLQLGRLAAGDPQGVYAFRYERLGLSDPEPTMCQTIKASSVIDQTTRDSISFWVGGLIDSAVGGSAPLALVRKIEGAVLALFQGPKSFIEMNKGFDEDCSWITNPLACLAEMATDPVADALKQIPNPTIAECGLPSEDAGNLGKQLSAFAKNREGQEGAKGVRHEVQDRPQGETRSEHRRVPDHADARRHRLDRSLDGVRQDDPRQDRLRLGRHLR